MSSNKEQRVIRSVYGFVVVVLGLVFNYINPASLISLPLIGAGFIIIGMNV